MLGCTIIKRPTVTVGLVVSSFLSTEQGRKKVVSVDWISQDNGSEHGRWNTAASGR